MMFAEERQKEIFQLISERHRVRVSELSRLLETSEVTIRRDLDALQDENKILRTHGGAVLAYSVGKAVVAGKLRTENTEAKKRIAKKALSRWQKYDTILLDSSSTVNELCLLIAEDRDLQLRIITTSLLHVSLLAEGHNNHHVMIIGGEYNKEHQTIEGYSATAFIKGIRVDKCFIGVNGIDVNFGFSTPRYEDAEIKNCMIESSVEAFILADKTKLGKVFLAKIQSPSCLITDDLGDGFDYEAMDADLNILTADASAGQGERKESSIR